jgi:hypothetical protein
MARKALCVGINDYPGLEGDLRGCVSDARAWAALLSGHYGFAASDVRLLLDREATRAALLGGLDRLLAGARPGDVLVFTSSCHGTYVPDRDGAEPAYDAALCPYDYRSNLVLEDELCERFANVPAGVRLVFVCDACHAGAVSRHAPPGAGYRRARFLAPEEWGGRSFDDVARVRPRASPAAARNDLLLAGGRAHQYCYDARFGDAHHGALTYYALQAIREQGYELSWAELHALVCERMAGARFPQQPRLEGRDEDRKRRVFS